jgi:hypothetical protein
MALPPFIRTLRTGNVYIDPDTGMPTQIIPGALLTPSGVWVPISGDENGMFVQMSSGIDGTPHFDDAQMAITPGQDQTLIDGVVPAGVTRSIGQILVVARVAGIFTVLANGAVIGSGRTGPGCFGLVPYNPARPLVAGTEYQVIFTSRLNAPPQSVECYLQATDNNST